MLHLDRLMGLCALVESQTDDDAPLDGFLSAVASSHEPDAHPEDAFLEDFAHWLRHRMPLTAATRMFAIAFAQAVFDQMGGLDGTDGANGTGGDFSCVDLAATSASCVTLAAHAHLGVAQRTRVVRQFVAFLRERRYLPRNLRTLPSLTTRPTQAIRHDDVTSTQHTTRAIAS